MFGRVSRTALVYVVGALGIILFLATEAQGKRPFEFGTTSELILTPDELRHRVRIEVLNNSTGMRQLEVTLGEFGFVGPNGGPLTAKEILRSKSPLRLPGAGSAEIVLGPVKLDPKPGEYSAWLTVSDARTDTVIRREVRIAVTGPVAKLSPTPAVGKLMIVATRPFPWGGGDPQLSGNELPLDVPAGTTADGLSLAPGDLIGYLTGRGGVAAITWSDEVEELANGQGVGGRLMIRDLRSSGDYTGTIDFLPDVQDAGGVEIELSATDLVFWPVGALLIGVAVAFWVKRMVNVRRVAARLGESLAEIVATFDAAELEFARESAGKPYAGYTIADKFNEKAEKVKEELDDLGIVILDSTKHDNVNAKLGHLRHVATTWSDFEQQLAALDDEVARIPPSAGRGWPAVREPASAPLAGRELESVEDYRQVQEKVAEATALLESWNGMYEQLTAYRTLASQIELSGELTPEQRSQLKVATQTLDGVEHELWTVETAEGFQSVGTEEDLINAENALSGLTGLLKPDAVEEATLPTRPLPVGAGHILANTVRAAAAARQARDIDWNDLAGKYRRRRLWGDLVVALIATVLAVWSGLGALYFNESFGGATNYLATLLWGLGTEATVSVLFEAVGRLGGQTAAGREVLPQLAVRPSTV